jgi:N-formylglutamate amidohydrolase
MSAIVIGVPHAGVAWPEELKERLLPHVTPHHLLTNSDAFTDRIYSVPGVRVVCFPWSRFVVDPNRAVRQVTEGGVVPHADFAEQPLYRPGMEPDLAERDERVARYHRPFHARIAEQIADPRTRFYIDAHSMAGSPPVRSFDFGRTRPDVTISNLGDGSANPSPGTPFLTCPTGLTAWLAERLSRHLLALPAPDAGSRAKITGAVWLNNPFPAGYGVRTHTVGGLRGIQLELNQRMWTDEDTFAPLPRRIPWIREVFRRWAAEVTARLAETSVKAS